jgi:hypothetical protein
MSMGQQLGSQTNPNVLGGMTPAAGNKALPGAQPGRPPQNQLQQAMAPKGLGPVAPGPLAGLQSSSGQFKAPMASPVAPQGGTGGMGSITGLTQNTGAQQAIIQQRNQMRQARGGGY